MIDRLLTEIQRQQKYLDKLPGTYTFPLFNAKTALESQRRNGYRNTASAAREIVDNSLEAGAGRVDIVFETDRAKGGKQVVTGVAFIDNGAGMLRKMARFALSWGGGTHFEDPHFIGRFGFGLPNASINQTRRVEVYSRTTADEPITKAWLDADDYPEHGIQEIPEPVDGELPGFVQSYMDRNGLAFDHGTVVYWKNPDRLTYKTPANLKDHLLDDFGTTYRYLLERFELIVEGVAVQRVDPMFLDKLARFHVSDEAGGAKLIADKQVPVELVRDPLLGTLHLKKVESSELEQLKKTPSEDVLAVGVVRIRVARFPLGFVFGRTTDSGIQALDEDSKKRFQIRATRRGMSFVRANREIETVNEFPRNPDLGDWPLLQGYAYHWGIETQFDPELDEAFGITNDKQRVRPIEDFWRILHDEEIDELLNREQRWQGEQRHKARLAAVQPVASPEPSPAEVAAAAVDKVVGLPAGVPDHQKPVVQRKVADRSQERSRVTGESIKKAEEALKLEAAARPYRVDYFEEVGGPFYKPDWDGMQLVAYVNRKHSFYEALYTAPMCKRARQGLDLLLVELSRAELRAQNEQTREWYEYQRTEVWSKLLAAGMKNLLGQFPMSETEEAGEVAA